MNTPIFAEFIAAVRADFGAHDVRPPFWSHRTVTAARELAAQVDVPGVVERFLASLDYAPTDDVAQGFAAALKDPAPIDGVTQARHFDAISEVFGVDFFDQFSRPRKGENARLSGREAKAFCAYVGWLTRRGYSPAQISEMLGRARVQVETARKNEAFALDDHAYAALREKLETKLNAL